MADDPAKLSEYTGWQLDVFLALSLTVQVAAVAARSYAQRLIGARFRLDDGLVLASLASQFVAAGISLGSVIQGAVGYHIEYLEKTNPEAVTLFFKYLVAISAWYLATVSIAKVVICLLYMQLFPQRSVKITIYLVITVMILTAGASLIADLAACRPFSANWASPEVQGAHCINKEALFIWSTFPNILTDAVLLTLPMPIVWRLHATRQLKVALTITFLFGSLGLVASILRFAAFANTNSFEDATFHAVELLIWTNAEPGIYLVSACLLRYRPILEKFKVKLEHSRAMRSWASRRPSKATTGYATRTAAESTGRGISGVGGDTAASSAPRSIALRSWNANAVGFERIPEQHTTEVSAAGVVAHGGGADPRRDGVALHPTKSPPRSIRVTTNIRQTWNDDPQRGFDV